MSVLYLSPWSAHYTRDMSMHARLHRCFYSPKLAYSAPAHMLLCNFTFWGMISFCRSERLRKGNWRVVQTHWGALRFFVLKRQMSGSQETTPQRWWSPGDLFANWAGLPFGVKRAWRCSQMGVVVFQLSVHLLPLWFKQSVCGGRDRRGVLVYQDSPPSHSAGTELKHSRSPHTPPLGRWLHVISQSGQKVSSDRYTKSSEQRKCTYLIIIWLLRRQLLNIL